MPFAVAKRSSPGLHPSPRRTRSMYSVCADTNDVGVISVPLSPEMDLMVPEVRPRLPFYIATGDCTISLSA